MEKSEELIGDWYERRPERRAALLYQHAIRFDTPDKETAAILSEAMNSIPGFRIVFKVEPKGGAGGGARWPRARGGLRSRLRK